MCRVLFDGVLSFPAAAAKCCFILSFYVNCEFHHEHSIFHRIIKAKGTIFFVFF